MVLLTQSAISAAISGGIICTFTFLLFLSGYVLQQQTVRSLQEALRNPPEKIPLPIPTLPAEFQRDQNEGSQFKLGGADQVVLSSSAMLAVRQARGDEASVNQLWQEYVRSASLAGPTWERQEETPASGADESDNLSLNPIVSRESLAYIFAVPDTDSLCSVRSFALKHENMTRLVKKPNIVLLYPATWDVSGNILHIAAMDLLREMQDTMRVVLHPVSISRVWAGVGVEQQLLAELQRYRWSYDRAMYLGSPGMTIDTSKLDEALALSNTKASWTILHPNPKSYEASHPPVLLWVSGRGLLYPREDMKPLISHTRKTPIRKKSNKSAIEAGAERAAYVILKETEPDRQRLEHPEKERLFERFASDRRAACAGTGLIDV